MADFVASVKNSKKNLINLTILLVLVLALPLIFKLAKETQIFAPKASSQSVEVLQSTGVTTKQENGRTIIETTTLDVQLQINSPLDGQQSSDASFELVRLVNAREEFVADETVPASNNDPHPKDKYYRYCGDGFIPVVYSAQTGAQLESCILATYCKEFTLPNGMITADCVGHGASATGSLGSRCKENKVTDYRKTERFGNVIEDCSAKNMVCEEGGKDSDRPFIAKCVSTGSTPSAGSGSSGNNVSYSCDGDVLITGLPTGEVTRLNCKDQGKICGIVTSEDENQTAQCIDSNSSSPQAPGAAGSGSGSPVGQGGEKSGTCAGYPEQCYMSDDEPGKPTGEHYCTGGRYQSDNSNNACQFAAGYTTSCSACQRPGTAVSIPSQPAQPGGNAGSASNPAASFGGSKSVNTCVGAKTLDQLRSELRVARGYDVASSESESVKVYNDTVCPVRPADCKDNPPIGGGIGDKPAGYKWVANCTKACLKNSDCPVSTDPSIAGDPGMHLATAANPNKAINKTNWCYGFQGGNRCLMLMRDGTAASAAAPAGGATAQVPANSNWMGPSCNGGKQVGCKETGQAACTNYGTTAASFALCQTACEPKAQMDAKCATPSPAQPAPAGISYEVISGTVTDTCNKLVANVKFRLSNALGSVQELTSGTDGKFANNSFIGKGAAYKVQIITTSFDQSAYLGLAPGYQITKENCGTSCNYRLLSKKSCGTTLTAQSVGKRIVSQDDQRVTTQYRVSDNLAQFADDNALWQTYTPGGMNIDFTISGTTPGTKSIFVQFKDDQGNIFNANPYPIQIVYKPVSEQQNSDNAACVVGKVCGQNCGTGGPGVCDDCGGGWCNGGTCSTCQAESTLTPTPAVLTVSPEQAGNSCTVGQACSNCGDDPGHCTPDCNGGWCNGGVCATCQSDR